MKYKRSVFSDFKKIAKNKCNSEYLKDRNFFRDSKFENVKSMAIKRLFNKMISKRIVEA